MNLNTDISIVGSIKIKYWKEILIYIFVDCVICTGKFESQSNTYMCGCVCKCVHIQGVPGGM